MVLGVSTPPVLMRGQTTRKSQAITIAETPKVQRQAGWKDQKAIEELAAFERKLKLSREPKITPVAPAQPFNVLHGLDVGERMRGVGVGVKPLPIYNITPLNKPRN